MTLIFCGISAIPLLTAPFKTPVSKNNHENRTLAKWPETANLYDGFAEYAADINQYLEDHIIWREPILKLYAKLKFKILNTGSSDRAKIGKNGWLFLGTWDVMGNIQGVNPISQEEAQTWVTNALQIQKTVDQYGGKLLIALVPDKAQVYPEHLPSYIKYDRQNRRADVLAKIAKSANLDVIDLIHEMKSVKNTFPAYFKTDTHWTHEGALHAYQVMVRHLNNGGFDLPLIDKSYLKNKPSHKFSGDLAKMLKLEDTFKEQRDDLFAYKAYQTNIRDKSLLLLGDSFSGNMQQYWPYSFKSVIFKHHNWGNINLTQIRKAKADVVILQIVERGLICTLDLLPDDETSEACLH